MWELFFKKKDLYANHIKWIVGINKKFRLDKNIGTLQETELRSS